MTAPCILRLDREIASATDDSHRAILVSEKASYLARIGDLQGAEKLRSQLRESFGDGRDLRVSVRIMILEAIIAYFRDFGAGSSDRLARAKLLSTAAGNRELIALTCAWLSHIQYYEGKYSAALDSVKICMESIKEDDWACLVRVGLFFGDMHLLAGYKSASQEWYELARNAAVRYGDQAAFGAIIYNRASLKAFNLRVTQALGHKLDEDEVNLSEAECRSAVNYQRAASVSALEHLLIASQVSLKIIRREFSQALFLLNQVLPSGVIPTGYPYRSVVLAEQVLCHAAVGNEAAALEGLNSLILAGIDQLPIDDKLLVDWTLLEAASLMPALLTGYVQSISLDKSRQSLNSERQELRELLVPFLSVEDRFKSKKQS